MAAEAAADAEPDWRPVAGGGIHAWHDHRAHWMSPVHPPGARPGDTVLEAVIPLVVNGSRVEVVVRSVLLAAPSPLPALAGTGLTGVTIGLMGLLTVVLRVATAGPAGSPSRSAGSWSSARSPR